MAKGKVNLGRLAIVLAGLVVWIVLSIVLFNVLSFGRGGLEAMIVASGSAFFGGVTVAVFITVLVHLARWISRPQ